MDDIFMEHNRDTRPFGRKMRSMSVSDIVVVTRAGEKHAYYVDSVGYEQIDEFFQSKQPKQVGRTPKKAKHELEL